MPHDQWDIDMDASVSSTSVDEDNDVPNLWKTWRHDLDLQDMSPLVTDLDNPSDGESSFASASQDLFENEMFDNP